MKLKQLLNVAALAVSAMLATSASADLILAENDHTVSAAPVVDTSALGNPAVMAETSGCASASYCTLTELIAGGTLSAGGLNFGGFTLEDTFGYGGPEGLDTDSIHVSVLDFGGVIMLDYNFAPFGFGGPLPSLLSGDVFANLDLSFNVISNGTVDIFAAWLYDMAGAGTSDADYQLQVDMLLSSGAIDIADLFTWNDLVNNSVVDFDADDLAIFSPVAMLSVYTAFSQISFEGLNTFYYVDQLFFTEARPVPSPFTIGLLGLGLLALVARKRKA